MLIFLWGHLSYFINDFRIYLIALFIACNIFLITSFLLFKSNVSPIKKRIFTVLFFSLLSIIVLYSGVEVYFRYRFDESDSLGFLQVNGRWLKRHVVFNNYFFRDRNFDTKKKIGVTRIGVIGDSIGMGYGIKNVEDRFSNLLEKKLRSEGFNVEVYNLAKSGYDTQSEIEEYQRVKQLKFDWIVWEYFLNDAQPKNVSTGTTILQKESVQGKVANFLSRHSFFFDYVYWRLSARYDKTFLSLRNADIAAYYDGANFETHKTYVESFIKELKNENSKILVIIFPFVKFLPDYPAEDIHRRMNKLFHENGVDTIDMLNYLRGKNSDDLVVGRFDYHPNEYVNSIAADKLAHKLKDELKKTSSFNK